MRFEGYSNAVSSRRVRSINQRRRNVFECFHIPFNVLTFPLARGVLSIIALRRKYQQRRNEDEIMLNPWYQKIVKFFQKAI